MSPLTGVLTTPNGATANVVSGQVQTTAPAAPIPVTQQTYIPPDTSSYQPPVAQRSQAIAQTVPTTSATDSGMPTWAWVGLAGAAVYFLTAQFRMSDKDLIYITNAPIAELQRFVGIVSQTLLPIATVTTVIQQD